MTEALKTFSVLIAWNDDDDEQGNYGTIVRAANYDDAEAKARADMRENHIANHCDSDDDEEEIAESCAEYEHKDFRGNVIFGGSVQECYPGAIWKAEDLEAALRLALPALLGAYGEPTMPEPTATENTKGREAILAARKVLAEIDAI